MTSKGTGFSELDEVISATANMFSAGTVGFGKEGLKKGALLKEGIDVTKEITGAKAAEEANADARKRFEEEKVAALQDREDAQFKNASDQLKASRLASSSKSITTSNTSSRSGTNNLGGAERDFLGL